MGERKHKLTPPQRKVLGWMKANGGKLRILTGYKNTTIHTITYDGQPTTVVCCQLPLPYFLRLNGYIEVVPGSSHVYQLTDLGHENG